MCVLADLLAAIRRSMKRVGVQARQAGQGLVEYALILVFVAIVVVGILSMLGVRVSSVYQEVNCGLSTAMGNGAVCNQAGNNGNNGPCNNGNGNGNGNGNCNNNNNGNGNSP
jgi:pilus assembly protein Flp/PilA